MNIYSILSSVPHNPHYLKRYYNFIISCIELNSRKSKEELGYTERHHFCPKAKDLFPQYKSFSKYSWNLTNLTPHQHFIAHHLLWKAYQKSSMSYAFKCFCDNFNTNKQQRIPYNITRKSYAILMANNSLYTSNQTKNKVVAKNLITNEYFVMSKSDFDSRPDYIVGHSYGTVKGSYPERNKKISVAHLGKKKSKEHCENLSKSHIGMVSAKELLTGNIVRIDIDTFNKNLHLYAGSTVGMVVVKDKQNNTLMVSVNDSRFLSGELVHMSTGLIKCINKNGNIKYLYNNSDEVISGEYYRYISRKTPSPYTNGVVSVYPRECDLWYYTQHNFITGLKFREISCCICKNKIIKTNLDKHYTTCKLNKK